MFFKEPVEVILFQLLMVSPQRILEVILPGVFVVTGKDIEEGFTRPRRPTFIPLDQEFFEIGFQNPMQQNIKIQ